MKVVVIGTGHVGLIHAATMATIGHDVLALDDDVSKVEGLQVGVLPFYEPGLQELVDQASASGRLHFVQDAAQAFAGAEVAFICVGTPARPSGEPNLVAVERVVTTVGRAAAGPMVVVEKSTVPMATNARIRALLQRTSSHDLTVASNPEFLREGHAVADSLRPDRILVGTSSPEAHAVMRRLYDPMVQAGSRYFATDVTTAELAKHACNAFLALKISFANGLARVCEAGGADVGAVTQVMGADPRIGPEFLNAGLGWGGSCFPKDLAAFRSQSRMLGYDFRLLDEIARLNDQAIEAAFLKVRDALWNLEDKRVVLLGLAFKPGTDDIRDSPALRLANLLLDAGAQVVGTDPQANAPAAAQVSRLEVHDDAYAAAQGAHCLVVCTEWPEFRELDLAALRSAMIFPILIDCRNLFDATQVLEAGFSYVPTGRPAPTL